MKSRRSFFILFLLVIFLLFGGAYIYFNSSTHFSSKEGLRFIFDRDVVTDIPSDQASAWGAENPFGSVVDASANLKIGNGDQSLTAIVAAPSNSSSGKSSSDDSVDKTQLPGKDLLYDFYWLLNYQI